MTKQALKIVHARRNKILEYLIEVKTATVEQLSEQFKVSIPTIRRDLTVLDDEKQITKFHGGAKILDDADYCPAKLHGKCKERIAYEAAKHVNDGDTIFINTSSTSLLMIKYIKNKHVTIITNNVKAVYVKRDPFVNIILTGGELRIPKETLVGDFATHNINQVKADKCFLGCSGINDTLNTSVLQEAAINYAMQVNTLGNVFVLADSSKIGRTHSFVSSDLSLITHLITDSYSDKDTLNTFKNKGIKIIQAN